MTFDIQYGPEILRPFQPTHIQFIDHPSVGKVELLDVLGDDLAVVNAAKVSFGKESEYERWDWNYSHRMYLPSWAPNYPSRHRYSAYGDPEPAPQYRLKPADFGIMNYLMREQHGSPWEMVVFKFRVRCAIKVFWEWVRHRMSSFNVKSTRYVDWDDDFYMPELRAMRKRTGKPGNYTYESLHSELGLDLQVHYQEVMEKAMAEYTFLLSKGMAAELAANVLPMGAMTEFIWCVNLRSLFNFLHLRNAAPALWEIREHAMMVEALAETICPEAFKLFNEHGRQAP